jgi:hypothetical protein
MIAAMWWACEHDPAEGSEFAAPTGPSRADALGGCVSEAAPDDGFTYVDSFDDRGNPLHRDVAYGGSVRGAVDWSYDADGYPLSMVESGGIFDDEVTYTWSTDHLSLEMVSTLLVERLEFDSALGFPFDVWREVDDLADGDVDATWRQVWRAEGAERVGEGVLTYYGRVADLSLVASAEGYLHRGESVWEDGERQVIERVGWSGAGWYEGGTAERTVLGQLREREVVSATLDEAGRLTSSVSTVDWPLDGSSEQFSVEVVWDCP